MVYDPLNAPSGSLNYNSQYFGNSPSGFTPSSQGGWSQGNYYFGQPQSQAMSFAPVANNQQAPMAQPSQASNPLGASSSSGNPLGSLLGAVQLAGGIIGTEQLKKKPFPEYKETKELSQAKDRSARFAKMGYTPAQRNVFMQDLARVGNEDYINAINMSGGNLARALNARRSAARFNALNQFAQGDAAQMMSNIRYDDSMTDKIQRLQDLNTQVKLNRRMALEQAYGGAIKAGTENIVNSFDTGQAMQMIAGMG